MPCRFDTIVYFPFEITFDDNFNELKYEIFYGDMELDLEHQLMFNSDWGNIFFSDNQYVTIGFKHKYIVYETDSFNVLEDIQEFLK